MRQFIIDNAQWIFSGIGVAIVAGAIRLFFTWRAKHIAHDQKNTATQSIVAGHTSTNIQTGNASTVTITATQPRLFHDACPTTIDGNGAVIHKAQISEGDCHEFIWGSRTVRISVSEIVRANFHFSRLRGQQETFGAVVDFSTGGGLVYGGTNCKEMGVNRYLMPQKEFHEDEPYSVYAYYFGEKYFTFIRVFVDHINQHSRFVTFNLAFVAIHPVKTI